VIRRAIRWGGLHWKGCLIVAMVAATVALLVVAAAPYLAE
jgi:hypothetical protein